MVRPYRIMMQGMISRTVMPRSDLCSGRSASRVLLGYEGLSGTRPSGSHCEGLKIPFLSAGLAIQV